MRRLTRDGLPNPSRETKFSGANEDGEKKVFLVQLTTSRNGNLTRLILLLLDVMAIHTSSNFGSFGLKIVCPIYRVFF